MRLARYFKAEMPEDVIEIYLMGLDPLPIDHFKHAASKLVRASKWMPKVCEFFEVVEQERLERIGSPELKADQQACSVIEAIRNIGFYNEPSIADDIPAHLLRTRWRWKQLCSMTETELKWWERDFKEAYLNVVAAGGAPPMIELNSEMRVLLDNVVHDFPTAKTQKLLVEG